MLCILFRIFGSGPKFQRCLPLGTKAPGKGICQYFRTTLPGANNVFPVEWWGLFRVAHPHRQLPRTALQTYFWDPNKIKPGRALFFGRVENTWWGAWLLGSSEAWWFTADLRLRPGSSFDGGHKLCVLSVSRRPDSGGWGLKTGKKSVVLVACLDWINWSPDWEPTPREQFVFWCLGFPQWVKSLVFLRDAWEIKHGFNFTSACCFFLFPVCSFPLHPSLASEVYFRRETRNHMKQKDEERCGAKFRTHSTSCGFGVFQATSCLLSFQFVYSWQKCSFLFLRKTAYKNAWKALLDIKTRFPNNIVMIYHVNESKQCEQHFLKYVCGF